VTAIPLPLAAALKRLVPVKDDEIKALLWSFAYFFCLLSSYYVLRPLRDEMGIQGGVKNLPWLFTGTFAVMLLAVPLFGALVARFPRRRIVPVAYRFFIVNILIFYALFVTLEHTAWVARTFFIWVSVFNLFAVSVFWSLMADLHDSDQGKRLFGFIAAGGSLGALLGPSLTATLAVPLGHLNLFLVSALLLEAALYCVRRLAAAGAPAVPTDADANGRAAIGGGILAGLTETARSPYLIGICLYIFLYTATSTFLYFLQAGIVAGAIADAAERTRLFALIDLVVGVLTLLIQVGVTGRLTRRFGVGVALAVLPMVTLAGFALLAAWPTVVLLIAVQGIRRAANFAVSRPAREVLYTVVSREWKYKAKNFIDTAVYRGGDALSGWAFAGLKGLGLGLAAVSAVGIPLALAWLALAVALGRRQRSLAGNGDLPPVPMYPDR
jgi:AAA family ATP:ADP antiporter